MADTKVFRASDFSQKRESVGVEIPSRKGVTVPMQAISLGALNRLRAACGVVPQPPMRQNPNKGSLAAPEPDMTDPAYLAERNEWGHVFTLAQVAVSMGYEPKGHGSFEEAIDKPKLRIPDKEEIDKSRAAWVIDAVEELEELFTDDDVAALIRGLRQANGEEVDAKKS